MPADEFPYDAQKRQFELEDVAGSPVPRILAEIISEIPPVWPFDKVAARIKDCFLSDSRERIGLLLDTLGTELKKHEVQIRHIRELVNAEEKESRTRVLGELVVDAARRASATRAKDRVKRIALILVNGAVDTKLPDGDEIEEMMRIAMELTDVEVEYLRELVCVQGEMLRRAEHIERQHGHRAWERGKWGTHVNNDMESAFSKMASYGLVSRIPPPNNLNIMADFQNRYVLLKKGLRFVALVEGQASQAE